MLLLLLRKSWFSTETSDERSESQPISCTHHGTADAGRALPVATGWLPALPRRAAAASMGDCTPAPEPAARSGEDGAPYSGELTPGLAADSAWCAAHAGQLRAIGLPPQLAQTLAAKLRTGCFDAGASASFGWADGMSTARDSWFVVASRDITAEGDVWLSDHVWVFENAVAARAAMVSSDELRTRLNMLVGTREEDEPVPGADALLTEVAPLAHPIKLASNADGGGGTVTYYCADEFGSRITLVPVGGREAAAEESPNVGFSAIYDAHSGQTLSVIWPLRDIAAGDVLRRAATPALELIAEGGESYWARRFAAEEEFDWYCGWDAIEGVVLDAISRAATIVADTCGSSGSGSSLVVLAAANGNSPLPVQLEASARPLLAAGHVPSAAEKALGEKALGAPRGGVSEGAVPPVALRLVAVDYVSSVVERMRAAYSQVSSILLSRFSGPCAPCCPPSPRARGEHWDRSTGCRHGGCCSVLVLIMTNPVVSGGRA
jgi:hypothetical protein